MPRKHLCPWPGCDRKVEAWRWGCGEHFAKLPADNRDRLTSIPSHWPEAKEAKKAATKEARRIQAAENKRIRDEKRIRAQACRKCDGPSSARLVRYCVPCHIADVTGDRS